MTASQTSTARPRMIIDCDPGHDDVFAIATAAMLCDVVGITTVAGNSPLENTTRNARIACDLFGLDSTEVHSGASMPLAGASPSFAHDAHGRSGLDGPPPRTPTKTLSGTDAVGYLVERTRLEEGLWIVAIGPLTNIALSLRADPGLRHRIAGLSIMGGSTTFGNVTSAGEFNVHFDPEAADAVFTAGVPVMQMFGLNVTHQVQAGSEMISALRIHASERSLFCAGLLEYSQKFNAEVFGLPASRVHEATAPMHDPCAVLGVVRPDLFSFERRNVVVETVGAHTRGMTHVDERPWCHGFASQGAAPTNCDVAYQCVAPSEALALIEEAVR